MKAASRVVVDAASATYEVRIGAGLLSEAGAIVGESCGVRHVAVVADATVAEYFGDTVMSSLHSAGLRADIIEIPPGESSKTWAQAGDILEALARAGMDRTGAVAALGGGVVGDLAGFCAVTYMRGVSFIQMPTTLLAQVDSAIGGKTAVDLLAGKNLAGAFMQPRVVIADTSALASLPETEWRSGLAEVAKSAVLDGEKFLAWLEKDAAALVEREGEVVQEAVRACAAFKARVVSADEHESGLREILNLGHTLGHAIEKVAGYGVVPHGLAVAEGMRFAARLAQRCVGAPQEFTLRQEALLDSLGLKRLEAVYDIDELRRTMSSDKKARGGVPRFVMARRPGDVLVETVAEGMLAAELRAFTGEEESS
ncbi:MAG: 3-dehydroquinate synthase [Coriobacteriia bacterium]|nr:3-dehydroquinate synthase [Coriobacteriia bacterium]